MQMFLTFNTVIIKSNFFSNINLIHNEDTGYSYIWAKINIPDVSQYFPTITVKVLFMVIDLDQIEWGTKMGYRLLLDSNNFSLSHALRWSILDTRNLIKYFQVRLNCVPIVFFKPSIVLNF